MREYIPDPEQTREREYAVYVRREANRNRKYAETAKQRVPYALFVEDVSFTTLYEAYKGRCGICGYTVCKDCCEVDHIYPLALNGTHQYSNCQPAHGSCNRDKGDQYRNPVIDNPWKDDLC